MYMLQCLISSDTARNHHSIVEPYNFLLQFPNDQRLWMALPFIHSFRIFSLAPLQETYSEALSVQIWPKRNVLRSLQREDTLFRGSKRSVRGNSLICTIKSRQKKC